ncbi:MAG TPA: hypothetical protein DCZ63_15275 [Geobacter sp.]|nr:hypothetical protein [Geobacter sp.]
MNESSVKESLLVLYPEFEVVYGPYLRKDGRKHVVLHHSNGKNRTISWPKAIVEAARGKVLEKNETADHIDRDFTNDSPDNLQILKRPDHARKDAIRVLPTVVTCQSCGKEFIASKAQRAKCYASKAGPFCSRQCVGLYGAELQNGRMVKMERAEIALVYYQT